MTILQKLHHWWLGNPEPYDDFPGIGYTPALPVRVLRGAGPWLPKIASAIVNSAVIVGTVATVLAL